LEAESETSVTLSPEQREKKHELKYEAEFVVELNMTRAHETGAKMGIIINRNADFEPATVFKVQKTGLIEDWNQAHPGQDVHVGDELVRVNDIQWHANTEIFMQRIRGQFEAGRKQVDGASDMLRLYIQRPRKWHHKRFAEQRADLHSELYAKEFLAELPLPDDVSQTTMDTVMGWKIGAKQEWEPVTIQKVEQHGRLAEWNQLHNDSLILEGDEILKVNHIIWHNNATKFNTSLQKHWKATQAVKATNRSIALSIRRPRPVQEAFDEAHPIEEIESCRRTTASVTLRFPEKPEDRILGWKITPGAKSATGVEGPVLVEKLRPTGMVARWNAVHLSRKVEAGDQIVMLNGVSWDKYDSPKQFFDAVQEVLSTARGEGPAGGHVQLVLEKPICSVREVRLNMEHGVHMGADDSQATTTPLPEARSGVAEEPAAGGGGGGEAARPVALAVRKGSHAQEAPSSSGKARRETASGSKALGEAASSGKALEETPAKKQADKSQVAEGEALIKARTRIAEIETTLKALETLKDPKVVALVVDLKKERDGLRATLFEQDFARIADIEVTLKTLKLLKDPKVVALMVDLEKERDGLRTKVGAKDDV